VPPHITVAAAIPLTLPAISSSGRWTFHALAGGG
jgi:hypothetical protein